MVPSSARLFRQTVFLWLLVAAGCTWKGSPQPSVLVILVENLRFGAFSCGEGRESSRPAGLHAFCDEAVRFTHAYTPSMMSQATVASLLTGKYPFEHFVRHNGAQMLSGKEETFAESALAKGYRTAFFSGGPPLWRRSGLSQGFEVFDDNIGLNLRSIYRPSPQLAKQYLSWLETEVAREKTAAFLFFSDLQFIDAATTNELGEVRESSLRSQLDAVDESLNLLIREMRKRKIWDSTEVYLIGLQGDGTRSDELLTANLFSEGTRSTLMIKPARKNRDGPFNWKIDANVSLVDVGATLFEFIGAPRARPGGGESMVHSLRSALTGPQPEWSSERAIISESAWPAWQGLGGVRSVVRRGPYLYVFDDFGILFNTLTDNPETTPLPSGDRRAGELRAEFAAFLRARGFQPSKHLPRPMIEKADLATELWRDREPRPETLEQLRELIERYPDDAQLRGWRAIWALRRDDWSELKSVSDEPLPEPFWKFVAARNLGEKAETPKDPCLDFLKSPNPFSANVPKECRIEGLSELLAWSNESKSDSVRAKSMDGFYRVYLAQTVAARIAEQNETLGRKWDTALSVDSPAPLDLILALPEFKKQRAFLAAKFKAEGGR